MDEAVFRGRRLAIGGSVCRDVKMGPLRPGQYLQEDGETPTAFITETIDGGGANSALAAAALGTDVSFAGKVGDDALGWRLEQSLVHHGVKAFLRRTAHVATGSSVVLGYENGCRHFVSCQYQYTAGTGDLLSVCMMLLHPCHDIPTLDRLQLANAIVAEYIEGRRAIIPDLT